VSPSGPGRDPLGLCGGERNRIEWSGLGRLVPRPGVGARDGVLERLDDVRALRLPDVHRSALPPWRAPLSRGASARTVPSAARGEGADDAPDLVEPIVGWRLWLVVADGGYLWLESALYRIRWAPRRALEARCVSAGSAAGHAAPDGRCRCGIHAAGTPAPLAPYLDSRWPGRPAVAVAIGRVRLWGAVVEGPRGWRGARAYPDALHVRALGGPGRARLEPSEVVEGLRDYGVPVGLLPAGPTLEAVAALARGAAGAGASRKAPVG
jgi:hypothetical protein